MLVDPCGARRVADATRETVPSPLAFPGARVFREVGGKRLVKPRGIEVREGERKSCCVSARGEARGGSPSGVGRGEKVRALCLSSVSA